MGYQYEGEQEHENIPITSNSINQNNITTTLDLSNFSGDVQLSSAFTTNPYSTYFERGQWITRSGVVSLSLYPTRSLVSWANSDNPNVFNAIRVDSWNRVLGRHSNNNRWKNTSSMRSQYICHINWARRLKTPWNLEPHRTGNASIANLCNP